MSRRALLSTVAGIGTTLALFGLALAAIGAGHDTLARILFWQNTLLQSLAPLGNIGTAAEPVYEGTPLNLLAFLASFPLGSILYGFAAYSALGAASRREGAGIMTTPANTIRWFGAYLLVLSAVLLIAPNALLATVDVPPTSEVWIRVVGMLAGFLGVYYVRAAGAGLEAFAAWTVPVRMSVLGFFGAFVALGFAPPALLLFGVVDAAGAAWTWLALRKARRA